MNPITKLIENNRHKKCVKTFQRIKNELKVSTSRTCVIYIATTRGYDELFKMISDEGWSHEISGDNREGIWLTVKKDNAPTLMV